MTQPHKAFVSSTFEDLKEHRSHAIRVLRNIGIFVDPMENWTAASNEPKCFSQDRVAGCDICVLLVAKRRGCIPQGESKSITQLEYEYAVRNGIEVLVFLLDEKAPWTDEFNEFHTDPGIKEWRAELRARHGCQLFGLDPNTVTAPIGEAIGRWLGGGRDGKWMVSLRDAAQRASNDYLGKKQRERVYLPALYARRIELEKHLSGFLDRKCTKNGMLIVGASGIGKTNTLCHIVRQWRDEPEKLGPDVVMLVDGSTLPGGQFVLREVLLDQLDIAGNINAFVTAFESQRQSTNAQLVIVVDGVDKHPQPGELLRKIDDLITRSEAQPWLKVIASIGEVVYGAISKAAGFSPSTRSYYTEVRRTSTGDRESSEIILGRLTDAELAEAYEKYRQEDGMAPTSSFDSLTTEVRNLVYNPLFLRVVMEVFNGRKIPRRVLTAEVLSEYCNKKVFTDPQREFFVTRFIDLLYSTRQMTVSFDSLAQVPHLRDIVLSPSQQSPYLQLLEEQVLEEHLKRVSPFLPPHKTVGFTYDRLLEYLLLKRLVEHEQFEISAERVSSLSEESVTYLPLRSVLTTLLLWKLDEAAIDEVVMLLQAGHHNVMGACALDLLMSMEHRMPTTAATTDQRLAEDTVGQLVTRILDLPCEWRMQTLLNFAEKLEDLGLYRRASFVLQSVCVHSRERGDQQAEATALLHLANLGTLQGHHRDAAGYCQQCQALVDMNSDLDSCRPLLLRAMANNYYRLGDLAKSKASCDAWLATYTGAEHGRLRADIYRIRGVVSRLDFQFQVALQSYTEGKALADEQQNNYLCAYFSNNIAEVHRWLGDLQQAEEWHKAARQIRQEIGDRSGLSMSYNNLGLVAKAWGERCLKEGDQDGWKRHYQDARKFLGLAVEIADEIGDDHRKADALNNLGTIARHEGRLEDSLNLYLESRQIFAAGEAQNDLGIVCGNLGITYYLQSLVAAALQSTEESRRCFEESGNESYAAHAYHNLAVIYRRANQSESIGEVLRRRNTVVSLRSEYPWPKVFCAEEITDLTEMPDI